MKKHVDIKDFLLIKYVSNPRFSPDAAYTGYIVTTIDETSDTYCKDLWVYDISGRKNIRITDSGKVKDYLWAGNSLVYWENAGSGSEIISFCVKDMSSAVIAALPYRINALKYLGGCKYAFTSVRMKKESSERMQNFISNLASES